MMTELLFQGELLLYPSALCGFGDISAATDDVE